MSRFKYFIDRLLLGFPVPAYRRRGNRDAETNKETRATTKVAESVKKGHFAVLAVKGDVIKRFVFELRFLADPAFLKLLELSKEEYGFRQRGAISVPCRPEELQKILDAEDRNVGVKACS